MKHKQPEAHHFLCTSVFEWHTGTDLPSMLKWFDKSKRTYWIWYVPIDEKEAYDIEFYQPQVEGSILLQEVEYKKGKRVTKGESK